MNWIESFQPVSDEIAIMRQFTFASSLQRMSVITRKLGAPNFELFSKGAPEMIASLSKPETGKEFIIWLNIAGIFSLFILLIHDDGIEYLFIFSAK